MDMFLYSNAVLLPSGKRSGAMGSVLSVAVFTIHADSLWVGCPGSDNRQLAGSDSGRTFRATHDSADRRSLLRLDLAERQSWPRGTWHDGWLQTVPKRLTATRRGAPVVRRTRAPLRTFLPISACADFQDCPASRG